MQPRSSSPYSRESFLVSLVRHPFQAAFCGALMVLAIRFVQASAADNPSWVALGWVGLHRWIYLSSSTCATLAGFMGVAAVLFALLTWKLSNESIKREQRTAELEVEAAARAKEEAEKRRQAENLQRLQNEAAIIKGPSVAERKLGVANLPEDRWVQFAADVHANISNLLRERGLAHVELSQRRDDPVGPYSTIEIYSRGKPHKSDSTMVELSLRFSRVGSPSSSPHVEGFAGMFHPDDPAWRYYPRAMSDGIPLYDSWKPTQVSATTYSYSRGGGPGGASWSDGLSITQRYVYAGPDFGKPIQELFKIWEEHHVSAAKNLKTMLDIAEQAVAVALAKYRR